MAAITYPVSRRYSLNDKRVLSFPKGTSAIVEGAFCTTTSGKVEHVDSQAETLAGIADESRSASETDILLVVEGVLENVSAITGASGTGDIGSSVYMTSNNNDLTKSSTGNALFGKIVGYNATTGFRVSFKSALLA